MEMMFWRSDVRFGLGAHGGEEGACEEPRTTGASEKCPPIRRMCPLVPISFRVAEDRRRASKHGQGWTDIGESKAKEGKEARRSGFGWRWAARRRYKDGILAVRRRYNDEIQATGRNKEHGT